jgi:uncharacterized sulfatase
MIYQSILIAGMLAMTAVAEQPTAGARPNFLIVIADDCTHNDLPLYGGRNVRTPQLDRLASEGMTFSHAYLSMSMCVPCRAELYTGLYPMRNGVCWNHSPARPNTQSICQHLGRLGYRVGLAGKVHASPRRVFPFEMVEGFERDCVAKTAGHECGGIRAFMTRNNEQPFCLAIGLVVPHVPWTVGDPSHFDPKALTLPAHLVDTPQTRQDYARYLAEIEVLDRQLGEILKTLDETGQADQTLVLFTSEQGAQFPGCKWTNWDLGVHTALIARWPGRIAADVRSDALVQYADVLPTLIEAAGGDPSAMDFDGSSFLPVLLGKKTDHRRYVYAMHNNVPEGPPYPIRSVYDGEFHYIRNLRPEEIYIERHVMGRSEHSAYWSSWMYATPDDPHAYAMVRRYMRRPAEELYRTGEDPFEQRNLAEDPHYAAEKTRLSAEVDRWMQSQGDPGAALDNMEALTARRREAAN